MPYIWSSTSPTTCRTTRHAFKPHIIATTTKYSFPKANTYGIMYYIDVYIMRREGYNLKDQVSRVKENGVSVLPLVKVGIIVNLP